MTAVLTHKQRIDRVLEGAGADRPPFTFWHHFRLPTPEAHAAATLAFHSAYRTDLVKVMSDFPYPKPPGQWYDLRPDPNPFPRQIRALELIRDGLQGQKYFVETIFNAWHVAEKLSSKEEVQRLKAEQPQALLDALDVITESQIHHARRALGVGASGVFFSIANATSSLLSPDEYLKFSAPFDRRLFEAVSGQRLSILHLHFEPGYLGFLDAFRAPILNYSLHVSGVPMAEVRREYAGVLSGGIDELSFRTLDQAQLRAQCEAAWRAAGPKFILTPGCSVPDDSTPEELLRLPQALGA